MNDGQLNFALNAFEVLFCTPDNNGILKSPEGTLLPLLADFLRASNRDAVPGKAVAADYLNALCRCAGDSGFSVLLARELFDSLLALNVFPGALSDAATGSDEAFLLENIRKLFHALREIDTATLPGGNEKLLPRAHTIFAGLPTDDTGIVEMLQKSDPFNSG